MATWGEKMRRTPTHKDGQAAGYVPASKVFLRLMRLERRGLSIVLPVLLILTFAPITIERVGSAGAEDRRSELGSGENSVLRRSFLSRYSRSPLSFTQVFASPGQNGSGASTPGPGQSGRGRYFVRGLGYQLDIAPEQALFSFDRTERPRPRSSKDLPVDFDPATMDPSADIVVTPPSVVAMKLAGANREASAIPEGKQPGVSNYMIGNDPSKWATGLGNYSRVRYQSVYPDIDLVYYGSQGNLEYDFLVRPDADPSQIRLRYEGVTGLRVDSGGDLVLGVPEMPELRHRKPFAYQIVSGSMVQVEAGYALSGDGEVSFSLGEYDRSVPLVIDPILIFSTYLGGVDDDFANAIAADTDGNCYVTGTTYSQDFPRKDGYIGRNRGLSNVWIAKFDPTGNLIFSTYFGGSRTNVDIFGLPQPSEDIGNSVSIDSARNIIIGGSTSANDLPTTSPVFGRRVGGIDGFITKFNPTGSSLIFSTYIGGEWFESVNHITVDTADNIYAVGITNSQNYPIVNAMQPEFLGTTDCFILKLNPSGTTAFYSTYFGGDAQDNANGVAVDKFGAVYVTGVTRSRNLPVRLAPQAALASSVDAFILKLAPSGRTVEFCTYYGGNNDDAGYGIELDPAGNIYVAGLTFSPNFPLVNAFQTTTNGGDDGFVMKISPGYLVLWASYLGGCGQDLAFDLNVDINGNVYLTGRTESVDFPTKDALQPILGSGRLVVTNSTPGNEGPEYLTAGNANSSSPGQSQRLIDLYFKDPLGLSSKTPLQPEANGTSGAASVASRDAFLTKISTNGVILHSTFLGGSYDERGYGIAIDHRGNTYLAGMTDSPDFPTKLPYQRARAGKLDSWITKVADNANTQTTVGAASFEGASVAPESIVAAFGAGLSPVTFSATTMPLPTAVSGVSVRVEDQTGTVNSAPLFFLSPFQINYVIPKAAALGPARITVWDNGIRRSTEQINIAQVAPGIFTANADGKDTAAAVVLRLKSNGDSSYESVYRFDPLLSRSVAVPVNLGVAAGDKVYLILFCSGVRNRASLQGVVVTIGGVQANVLYAGPQQEFMGLDQINLLIPPSLAGRGVVDIDTIVDNKRANKVTVAIR